MGFGELITQYDSVDGVIDSDKFPIECKESDRASVLVHFDEWISKKDALARLEEMGYEAAQAIELAAFGIEYPFEQLKFPILALGSLYKVKSHIYEAVYLYRAEGVRQREIGTVQLPDSWLNGDELNPTIRFLATREINNK